MIAIHYLPYVFRGSDRPTGFEYCVHAGDECVGHGLVFGKLESIATDLTLGESLAQMTPAASLLVIEWIASGKVPYLPAAPLIGHLGSCLLKEAPRVYSRRWIRRPGPNATDAAKRIYEARMTAREQNQSERFSHV